MVEVRGPSLNSLSRLTNTAVNSLRDWNASSWRNHIGMWAMRSITSDDYASSQNRISKTPPRSRARLRRGIVALIFSHCRAQVRQLKRTTWSCATERFRNLLSATGLKADSARIWSVSSKVGGAIFVVSSSQPRPSRVRALLARRTRIDCSATTTTPFVVSVFHRLTRGHEDYPGSPLPQT
ncbi:hypothetical protein FRC12_003142 [Ceratobasidium sp. 428]|nr:hypothetical protein FRC12_003142 [Ceratobasidium sp. 428]